jgi:formylmethanofuran dehydrogenase subunit B
MTDAANPPTAVASDHAVCLGCGCLCDDIRIGVANGNVSEIERACGLGRQWFESQLKFAANVPISSAVDPETLQRAAAILAGSRLPIFLGIEGLTTEAQRHFIALAEATCGIVASDAFSAIAARQEVGEATATLGEIKSRADLVVYWFADPMATHPRHLERYSADCRGRFIPNGRRDRTLIVVDKKESATAALADRFIKLAGDDELEAIKELRLQVQKPELGKPAIEQSSPRPWAGLAEAMTRARYGALVVDPSRHEKSTVLLEELFRLVIDLNDHTAFVVAPLGSGENVKGAENTLLWLAGAPANVAFQEGAAQYNGGEYSAEELLRRGRPDAAVVVGSWNRSGLSSQARERLERIPTIQIGGEVSDVAVHFPAATWLETKGTVFRMDGVPLPIDPVIQSRMPTAEEILERLLSQVRRTSG